MDVYQHIRALLVSGAYPPGTHLSERQLSTELGVSRTPVREALHKLQVDGLVVDSPRRGGAAVAGLPAHDVADTYVYRAALERLTAQLAAARSRDGHLSRRQLTELEELAEAVATAASGAPDGTAAAAANLRFHQHIAALAGNRFVAQALVRIWDLIAISSLGNLTGNDEWLREVLGHHRDIVAAIRDGDEERAGAVAEQHVRRAGDVYALRHDAVAG